MSRAFPPAAYQGTDPSVSSVQPPCAESHDRAHFALEAYVGADAHGADGASYHRLAHGSRNRLSFVEDRQGRVLWIEGESPKDGKDTFVSMDTSRSASELETFPRRALRCTGCHNRVAYDFSPSAATAVAALAQTKKANVGFDASQYPDQLGHCTDLGCFRCHDGRHRSTRGSVLTSDCASVCHDEPRILTESPPVAPIWPSPSRWHVGDLPDLTPEIVAHSRLLCSDCHSQAHAPKHVCEDCHHPHGLENDADIARRPDG